ncbi:hypothetical protein FA15DRAFT_363167 [Coprinopsis marcescibilis]|uniref:Uncharacterized protein n=1 Tax=Coprinopsis marcescibilis TaxID=230819 RepID=A0A5C3KAF5_COPMA|nr:hypothetical protein FA15DRAFT_363167 [Coprinopsis marcescibilis]
MSPANVPQYYGAEPLSLPPVVSQPSMQFQSHPQYDRDSHYPTSFPQPSRSTGLTDHSHDRSRGQSSSDALSGNGTFMTTSSNPIISTYSKGQRQPSRPISEAPPPAYNVATP